MSEDFDLDFDQPWQDESFATLRVAAAFVVEYGPMMMDPQTRLGWAIQDLRGAAADLLTAIMNDDQTEATETQNEIKKIIADII